jgi:hypothetical protein
MTRRQVLGVSLAGLPAIPLIVETAFAADAKPAPKPAPAAAPAAAAAAPGLPLLAPTDPAAKALGYIEDAKKVDAKANPMYKPDQHCANCLNFNEKTVVAHGKCNIFPGKLVASGGWCKVWAKKPA